MNNKEITSIHYLRGIAALLVVAYHNKQYLNNIYSQNDLGDILFRGGAFGVDLFFMISGFIIALSTSKAQSNKIDFSIKRFFRVYPLFIICLTSLIFLNPIYSETEIIRSVFLAGTNYSEAAPFFGYNILFPAWTLSYEIYFYIVFLVSMSISHKHRILISSAFLILPTLVLQKIFNGSVSLESNVKLDLDPALPLGPLNFIISPMLIEFVMGMIAFKASQYFHLMKNKKYISFILFSLFACFYFYGYRYDFGPANFGIWAFTLLIGSLLLDNSIKGYGSQSLRKLGDISYSLYLIHAIIMIVMIKYQASIPMYDTNGIAKFLLIVSTSLFVSLYVHKYIEMPILKIGRTIISKRKSRDTNRELKTQ
ncbi:acyltransferase [Serratia fonticola]|uniref:acyltransferase family protein n=1 Tax=Serratia fonticola TaxID=47917 RepID=UPI002097033D|nr:acyltransferase [Serratia fonticola]MCO7512409.1 acyltransferase [Serratia fonticola]